MSSHWSHIEVELIIADYFNMLDAEMRGENYNKAAHRRALLPLLNHRSEGAVEKKHQNISAALIKLGQPYIKGYLPLYNYQHLLDEKVAEYLGGKPAVESLFKNFAEKQIVQPKIKFETLLVEPPEPEGVKEPQAGYGRNPIKINYLEREQKNHHLGTLGEEMVLEFEKWNLKQLGKDKLAKQVRWISQLEGDGAGFDILSKDLSGKDKFIEVKTTKLSKKTPIYFSKNELDFSIANREKFYLYRLFSFEKDARMFTRQGALNQICHAEATNFKGYF